MLSTSTATTVRHDATPEHLRLVAHLQGRTAFKDPSWLASLEPRKLEEIEFHNFERDVQNEAVVEAQRNTQVHANKKWYLATDSSRQYVDQWMRKHSPGRVFLDYACGNGRHAIRAAEYGAAAAIGLDISDVSLANARSAAAGAGVGDHCWFVQGDCEATELPDSSVDLVLCSGMLHHLDLDRAFPELRRVVKPGGRILGHESWGYNPLFQLYRDRTPHMRTAWEAQHIMRKADLDHALRYFSRGEVRYWHLASLVAVPFRRTSLFKPMLAATDWLDRNVIARTPGLQLLAWQVTFELVNDKSA